MFIDIVETMNHVFKNVFLILYAYIFYIYLIIYIFIYIHIYIFIYLYIEYFPTPHKDLSRVKKNSSHKGSKSIIPGAAPFVRV